jgi:hypothetical protein
MTATWLTWRIHRFEILFVLALAALLGVSAWIIADQIRSLGLTDSLCWPRTENGDYATPACDRMMNTYWGVEGQGALVRVGLTIAPSLLGIILGVPIVARELELRTAGFSWALTPSRLRWLAARFLPMLLVGVVGLVVLAWAGTTLFDAMWLARRGADLTEIAGQGTALVGRGLAGIAVALLIGSLVGRTMPALLIAVVALGAWGLVAVPQAQAMLARERSVWVRQDDDSWRYGGSALTYSDFGTFDTARSGLPGEPGARVDEQDMYAETERQIAAACGVQPGDPNDDDYDYDSPEFRTWSECADPFWTKAQSQAITWSKEVPRSAWGDFATLDILMSALLGGTALVLTLFVVTRRRPE